MYTNKSVSGIGSLQAAIQEQSYVYDEKQREKQRKYDADIGCGPVVMGQSNPPSVAMLPNVISRLEQVLANLFKNIESIETVLRMPTGQQEGLNQGTNAVSVPTTIEVRAARLQVAVDFVEMCSHRLHQIDVVLQDL